MLVSVALSAPSFATGGGGGAGQCFSSPPMHDPERSHNSNYRRGCRCAECRRNEREYRSDKRKTATRASQLKCRYGITLDEYNALLLKQEGCCAICRRSFFEGEGLKACVDHDHVSGKVRGVLCDDCNVGLGRFKDDRRLLLAAHNYLVPDAPELFEPAQ